MKLRKILNGVLACTMALSMMSVASATELTENSPITLNVSATEGFETSNFEIIENFQSDMSFTWNELDEPSQAIPEENYSQLTLPTISTRLTPSSANVFYIKEFRVFPLVYQYGGFTAFEEGVGIQPNGTFVSCDVSSWWQEKLTALANSSGKNVYGWYIECEFYVDCYAPNYVTYKPFSESLSGGSSYGAQVSNNTATASWGCKFPTNGATDYSYGFTGNANMHVYYPQTNTVGYLTPTFYAMFNF